MYVRLSAMHKEMLKDNGIVSNADFSNQHNYCNLKAKAMSSFIVASPQYLHNLINEGFAFNDDEDAKNAMNMYLLYMSISHIINGYAVSIAELNFVDTFAPKVVTFISKRFPCLCTINLHYLLHMVELIKMFG